MSCGIDIELRLRVRAAFEGLYYYLGRGYTTIQNIRDYGYLMSPNRPSTTYMGPIDLTQLVIKGQLDDEPGVDATARHCIRLLVKYLLELAQCPQRVEIVRSMLPPATNSFWDFPKEHTRVRDEAGIDAIKELLRLLDGVESFEQIQERISEYEPPA